MKTTGKANKPPNPFHPQFGKRPDKFIGRDQIIRDFVGGIDNPNSPNRTTIMTGIRGSGKTALVSGISEAIDRKRFIVVDVTAGSELNQSILDQMQLELEEPERQITGVSVGALGFSLGVSASLKDSPHGFRYHLAKLAKECVKRKRGLVFLIDEIHNDSSDTREFVTSYQHLMRDGHNVALLMAGLPKSVAGVLNDKVLTFLHRSHRIKLGNVDTMLVNRLYELTFANAGFAMPDGLAADAAKSTCGFPYLIQLVGYYLWNASGQKPTGEDLEEALLNSKSELFQNVYQIMWREASEVDRQFLVAMLGDHNYSRFGELADRMGASPGYASKYRQRLIEAGFVSPASHGHLAFDPPYFKEFINSL
jgi:hypothetical protein